MTSRKRLMVIGTGLVAMALSVSVLPAGAQTKEARGTVTAVTEKTISVKAGAQDLTFVVDALTHLNVRSAARRIQAEQPGSPSPRVNDFFQTGNVVLIRYREEKGTNHAIDVSRVGTPGAGGGSVSGPAKIADGKVVSVTASQLAIEGGGHQYTFVVTGDTDVLARGASKATKAAGGTTSITTFVHAGDTVSVSYEEAGGTMIASQVRVRIVNR